MSTTMRRTMAILIALAMMIGAFAIVTCDVDAAPKPKKIYIKADAYKMGSYPVVDVKGKINMSVYKTSPSKASKSVTWKTSNSKIATVSSKGVVTGKKAGYVTIMATAKSNKKVKKSLKIRVYDLKIQRINISRTSALQLKRGSSDATYTFTAKSYTKIGSTYTAKGFYNPGVYWKTEGNAPYTSGKTVATINSSGKAYAKSRGNIEVYAQAKDNSARTSSRCPINVYQKATSLEFAKASINISIGQTYTNNVTVMPADANNKTVTYSSTVAEIASVSDTNKPVIKGESLGDAEMVASHADGVTVKCPVQIGKFKNIRAAYNIEIQGEDNKFVKYESSVPINDAKTKFQIESDRATFEDLYNSDINKIFGSGAGADVNMFDVASVEEDFADADLSYYFGNYVLAKQDSEMYVRYKDAGGEMVSKYLYYIDNGEFKSFKKEGTPGYTLTLYADPNPTAATWKREITFDSGTDTITFKAENRDISIHKNLIGIVDTVSLRSDGKLMTRITRDMTTEDGQYTLWLDQDKVLDEDIFIYEYK